MKAYNINKFLKVCLDIAEWVDDKSDADKNWLGGEICRDIGLGCRALSGYLRSGVKSVMELQEKYLTMFFGNVQLKNRDGSIICEHGEIFWYTNIR